MTDRNAHRFTIAVLLRWLVGLAFWVVHIVDAGPAFANGERLALLIGNSRYEHATPLRNPENDIQLMATSLKAAGFRTFLGKNASQQELASLVDDFVSVARATPRPTLLLYFAGHGVQFGDVNYLIPVDAKTSAADELRLQSFDATALMQRLLSVDPALAMLVLDACRDNPFEGASRNLKRGLSVQSLELGAGGRASQLIAFATAPGTTADDGDSGNSPYASALAESIIAPGLPLEVVFRETRRKVVDRTKGRQQPWESVSLFSEFYFIPPDARPPPPTDEAAFWDLASIVNSAEIYQRYLDRFPSGTFVELARWKIAAINSDFSYRRKAELFPVVKVTANAFPNCTDDNAWKFYIGLRHKLEEHNGQIVYLRLEFPIQWLYCRLPDGTTNYRFAQFIRGARGDCDLFRFGGDGIDSYRTTCTSSDQLSNTDAFDHRRIFRQGGLVVGYGDDTTIYLPSSQEAYFRFKFEHAEGVSEEMRAEFAGLARLTVFRSESHVTVVVDPVDPKGLGVSWKFDNTVAAARNLPDTDLSIDSFRSVTTSAMSPDESASAFSVFPNRTMSCCRFGRHQPTLL